MKEHLERQKQELEEKRKRLALGGKKKAGGLFK
jgi:hypothetical protein